MRLLTRSVRRLLDSFASAIVLAALATALVMGAAASAPGAVVFSAEGLSAEKSPVAFRATFAIAGDTLSLLLENVSPVASTRSADLLSSFAFDVVGPGGRRPEPRLVSATGRVVQVVAGGPDTPVVYTPPARAGGRGSILPGCGLSDLAATKPGDETWQFRTLDPRAFPGLAFGIGTVAASHLDPNGFDPAVVGKGAAMTDFAIARGDVEPQGNLRHRTVVRDAARFTWSGFTGFSAADVVPRVMFGAGTGPDTVLIAVPEPATATVALGLIVAAAVALFGRRYGRHSTPRIEMSSSGPFGRHHSSTAVSNPATLSSTGRSREARMQAAMASSP
jgi:hypothetical protein